MKTRKKYLILSVFFLWMLAAFATSAGAAWKTTSSGKMYTTSGSPGYATGWLKIGSKYYYFNDKGILQTKKWIGSRYVDKNGAMVTGVVTISGKTYYFVPSTSTSPNGQKLVNKILKYKKGYYYFNKSGVLVKNSWIGSKYYASKTGKLLTGLAAIKGKLYYFNKTNLKKVTNTMVKVGSSYYYFQKDGTAVAKKWVVRGGKYYYFKSNRKMAVSTWVGSSYYVGKNGARVTGLQTIGKYKYYFDTSGKLTKNTVVTVGNHQYTLNSKGQVTATVDISVSGNTTGVKIVNTALKYVGNKYVYGGNSLTTGTDCSGFTMLIFAMYGFKLPRVANDQMNSYASYGGAVVSLSNIQPGDLLFYGSGNYASHVAIYMGNKQIVHASNSQPYPKGGVKVSTYNYNTPIRAIRYWK